MLGEAAVGGQEVIEVVGHGRSVRAHSVTRPQGGVSTSPKRGRASPDGDSTVPDPSARSPSARPPAGALYAVSTTAITLVMVLGVIDAIGWFNPYGVDSARVAAAGGGYRLDVQYTAYSPRPRQPVRDHGPARRGFDGPVTIGVNRTYLEIWDENGLFPHRRQRRCAATGWSGSSTAPR